MDDYFDRWLKAWTEFVVSSVGVDQSAISAEFDKDNKIELAADVFARLQPPSAYYLSIVEGKAEDPIGGLNYNRLLKSQFESLPFDIQTSLSSIFATAFNFGVLTQLIGSDFPNRHKVFDINMDEVVANWLPNTLLPSRYLGKVPDLFDNIIGHYMGREVEPFLKNNLSIGAFRMGKHRVFFKEIYFSGVLLAMETDLATNNV